MGRQEEETAPPRSQFSLDGARTLLQGMRRTYTADYYDRSLLENPSDVPLRNVAPNEYRQVNPILPNENENPLTLGDYLGQNPSNHDSRTTTGNQPGTAAYNPNSGGVSRNWSGGADRPANSDPGRNDNNNFQGGTQTRTDTTSDRKPSAGRDGTNSNSDIQQPWNDLFRYNYTLSGDSDTNQCDGIGPGTCTPPAEFEFVETRTEEGIEKELWQPGDMSRYMISSYYIVSQPKSHYNFQIVTQISFHNYDFI